MTIRAGLGFALVLAVLLPCGIAPAATPESPDVKKMVTKALEFLEQADHDRLGGKCLIGLAFIKTGKDDKHPKVAAAVAACRDQTQGEAKDIRADIYSTGIAIIFLCNLDPSKYHQEIIQLLKSLELRQKPHGGWGYPERETGDTSMTQYGALSLWEAARAGFAPPPEVVERLANWLLRTQDPKGGWGYQGKDPGTKEGGRFGLVKQSEVRLTLGAAGLGSTYICADMIGLSDPPPEEDPALPSVLRPVKADRGLAPLLKVQVDSQAVRRALERGSGYMKGPYNFDGQPFPLYFLYGLERYYSFMEDAEGRRSKEPTWYNDGVKYLKEKQAENGSWKGKDNASEAVDTSFGVLFLVRSTRKSIEHARRLAAGRMAIGQGLPGDLKSVRVRGGRVVSQIVEGPTDELLAIVARPEHARFHELASDPRHLVRQIVESDEPTRAAQLAELAQLSAKGSNESRLAAVRIMGRTRLLETAPALIAALADPDWQVVSEANESLRSVSRRIQHMDVNDKLDETTRAAAVAQWQAWYQSVHPQAE